MIVVVMMKPAPRAAPGPARSLVAIVGAAMQAWRPDERRLQAAERVGGLRIKKLAAR